MNTILTMTMTGEDKVKPFENGDETPRDRQNHTLPEFRVLRGDAATMRSETPLRARPCDTATLLA